MIAAAPHYLGDQNDARDGTQRLAPRLANNKHSPIARPLAENTADKEAPFSTP